MTYSSLLSRLRRDRHGQVAILAAIVIVAIFGFTAIVVDVVYVLHAYSMLQAATRAAALAGAQDINCCSSAPGTAINTAISYSAVSGNKNANPNLTVTMGSGYPMLKCLQTTGISCGGPDNANAIIVKQQATVPTYFARVLGIPAVPISVVATAGREGGVGHPADVMLVLDTTDSMNNADPSCAISGATRLACALAGVRTLLAGITPPSGQVGLMVFPGLTATSQVSKDYDCSSGAPKIAAYKQTSPTPVYQIIPFASDYQASGGNLSTSSNLVKASGGGASGCTQGLAAVGGVGTFYADAITAAQTALATNGRTGVAKMIVFLGDGDANASSSYMTSAKVKNQCHQAITAAQTATAAGTAVYTIAYGASTSSTSSCSTDTTHISACATLQQMASDSSKFYSDTVGGTSSCTSAAHSITDLSQIFQDIGASLSGVRLLPNDAS